MEVDGESSSSLQVAGRKKDAADEVAGDEDGVAEAIERCKTATDSDKQDNRSTDKTARARRRAPASALQLLARPMVKAELTCGAFSGDVLEEEEEEEEEKKKTVEVAFLPRLLSRWLRSP
ncbi:hypothetical protein MGYG_08898 [Nannizzia gypsea CBS 118893]|uniref:Uncharacterized protein n=1 Tax=Arthroderma gypseum (strain ATCC MYA-4604 / CBS 118893) TaxID=535722 RepID=E5R0T3_ARTGP|nr:hypothetical protein MGYG_08898 [Nannizzia gypsea CBS 118893]EFQ97589.1 hypothetical protein MGYG_08898 [Nannizzia gypsea CBS 118893]